MAEALYRPRKIEVAYIHEDAMWFHSTGRRLRCAGLTCFAFALVSAPCVEAQEPQLVLSIGATSGAAQYEFGRVEDAQVSRDGNLYILDGLNHEVRVFSADGRFVRSFGRQGSGPGEFLLPNRLRLLNEEVRVFDPRLQRITIFSLNGALQRTLSVPGGNALNYAMPMRFGYWLGVKSVSRLSSADISAIAAARPSDQQRVNQAYRMSNRSFVLSYHSESPARADTLLTFDPGAVLWYDSDENRAFGILDENWGAGGLWTTSGDSVIAAVDTYTGQVRGWRVGPSGLVPVRSGRLPFDPRPIEQQDLLALVQRAKSGRPNLPRRMQLIAPEYQALVRAAVLADDGSLWLDVTQGGSRGQPLPTQVLVIPVEGARQRVLSLSPGFRLLAVSSDRLIGVRRTSLDVDVVEVWQLPTRE